MTAGCRYETAHACRALFVSTNEKKARGDTWTKVVIVKRRARDVNAIVDAYILRTGEACDTGQYPPEAHTICWVVPV